MSQGSRVSISLKTFALKEAKTIDELARKGSEIRRYDDYSAAVRVGPYIYISGLRGRQQDTKGQYTSMVGVLHVGLKTWRWILCEGYSEQGTSMFLYGDSLIRLGRTDLLGVKNGNLSRFDLSLNEWSYCHTVGEGPGPRLYFSGHVLEHLKHYVVFGGYPNQNDSSVFILGMPEFRWSKAVSKGTPPKGRCQQGSCVYRGVIYIYGGKHHGIRCHDLYLLKVGSGRTVTWSSPRTNAADFGGRSSFLLIPCGRILLLCGGYDNNGRTRLSYYDPESREFTKVDIEPHLIGCLGCGTYGAYIENGHSVAILRIQNSEMLQVSVKD